MRQMRFTWRNRRKILFLALKCIAICIGACFMFVPAVIYMFPGILKIFIFLSIVRHPWFVDFTRPEGVGLKATRNFYIESEDNIQLGAWHILPKSLANTPDLSDTIYELSLRKGLPIILYLHGNAGNRASSHRVELYNILRNIDAHVIAFDYRGYGDSTSISPTEEGVVRDTKAVFRWLKQRMGSSPLFVWGHSLGTGIGTRAVSELCQEGNPPKGLVLEAPFSNMSDEILQHPFSKIFSFVPYMQYVLLDALKSINVLFESDKHIAGVTVPIVILHAKDDKVIPMTLGMKLYQAALDGRPKTSPTSVILFDDKYHHGHVYICRAPRLPDYISQFVKNPEEKILS